MRWTVEFFHDVVKNGGSQEDRRFKTAGRRETCRALRSLVAVRVLRRRRAREHLPEEPAEEVATAAEIGLIR